MSQMSSAQSAIRVAIVDDSRSVRLWLSRIFASDPRIEVVGEAASCTEARDLLRRVPVDVMTLDVEMPGMSGLEFLQRLMRRRPMPVIMISSLTGKDSHMAVQALGLGAVDCMEKPQGSFDAVTARILCQKVLQAAKTQVATILPPTRPADLIPASARERSWSGGVILLGASTGGVTALEAVLSEIDDSPWPVVIAQHMPDTFLYSFARRLNDNLSRNVYIASEGHVLRSGQVVLAIGKEQSTRLRKCSDGSVQCTLGQPSPGAHYRPSVDDLFLSAAQEKLNGVAGILTGMGNDGAEGMLALRNVGFFTAGQNKASCVVYGMPKAAQQIGAVMEEMPDVDIGRRFAELTGDSMKYRGRMRA